MKELYQQITKERLTGFEINKLGGKFRLTFKNCQNHVTISIPFILNEKIATLAGMMPDGSLIKDLRRIYFTQKKDLSKHAQFQNLLQELFELNHKIFMKDTKNSPESYTNSKVLCYFLYYILDFNKSNEEMKIPYWVFKSPKSVKEAYLREAFAMEGTIFKSLKEIRFITKDYSYAQDIQNLLSMLEIKSFLKERIAGTPKTIQYRISIYRKENFAKFKEIGFTVPMHKERFSLICQKYGI